MRVTVTGASDDLIEIDGDIREEFNVYFKDDEQDFRLLAFGDGTILRVVYDKDGIWRITRLTAGTAEMTKVDGDVVKDTFDEVTLTGDLKWVVLGKEWAKP